MSDEQTKGDEYYSIIANTKYLRRRQILENWHDRVGGTMNDRAPSSHVPNKRPRPGLVEGKEHADLNSLLAREGVQIHYLTDSVFWTPATSIANAFAQAVGMLPRNHHHNKEVLQHLEKWCSNFPDIDESELPIEIADRFSRSITLLDHLNASTVKVYKITVLTSTLHPVWLYRDTIGIYAPVRDSRFVENRDDRTVKMITSEMHLPPGRVMLPGLHAQDRSDEQGLHATMDDETKRRKLA